MISSTGKNLSIIILTEPGLDWQAFATWYSVFKNLPDATPIIASKRNKETPFQLFQWAKRLNIRVFHHNEFDDQDHIVNQLNLLSLIEKTLNDHILLMNSLTMALSPLDKATLDKLNKESWIDENMLFFKQPNIKKLFNEHMLETKSLTPSKEQLCFEASEEKQARCLISYKKGCGKWLNKLKGCPFSNAAGLVSNNMTVNEVKIVELWKRMCSLYSIVI